MDTRRPRHIRDIAHLYLSGSEARAERLRVDVTSSGRDCVPGFHVANIAAALAASGRHVRVHERSGLLPNAAYYLSLPPSIYARYDERIPPSWVSALSGIDVLVGAVAEASPPEREAPVVDLVHHPPGSSEVRAEARNGDPVVALLLCRRLPGGEWPEQGHESRWVALLGRPDALRHPPAGIRIAGRLSRWEGTVADRVPAVVRDRGSALAREYLELGRRLASGKEPPKRNGDASTWTPAVRRYARRTAQSSRRR